MSLQACVKSQHARSKLQDLGETLAYRALTLQIAVAVAVGTPYFKPLSGYRAHGRSLLFP
jgi:hypothetical protein